MVHNSAVTIHYFSKHYKMTTVSVFKLESLSKTELLDPQHNHQLPALLVSLLGNLPIINNRREIIIKEENGKIFLPAAAVFARHYYYLLFLASIYAVFNTKLVSKDTHNY